jgi:hypothetical protein
MRKKAIYKRDTIASVRAELLVVRSDVFMCMREIQRLRERLANMPACQCQQLVDSSGQQGPRPRGSKLRKLGLDKKA